MLVTPERITQALALMATLTLLWALGEHHHHHHERSEFAAHEVQLSLLAEPPAAEPPPPAPKPPRPEPQKPRSQPQRPVRAPAASPAALTAVTPELAASSDATQGEPHLAAASFTPVTAPARGSVEDAYAAALRQNVDARTTVPDSAQYRLLRPSGAAQVRFALDRVGNPSDVGVARSSGSGILDRQAVSIVATGHYPPFPETAYAGESRHVFIVTIEFRS